MLSFSAMCRPGGAAPTLRHGTKPGAAVGKSATGGEVSGREGQAVGGRGIGLSHGLDGGCMFFWIDMYLFLYGLYVSI